MTNKEKFFAGHLFDLHGQAAQLRTLYGRNWLMVDGIQQYYIPDAYTEKSFTYEKLFTPFDSTETMLFDTLKFISNVED